MAAADERRAAWLRASQRILSSLPNGYAHYKALSQRDAALRAKDRQQIRLDVSRTFGLLSPLAAELGMPPDCVRDQRLIDALEAVLCAYCTRAREAARADGGLWCGFVQGMSFVAGVPVLVFAGDEASAFGLVVAVLDNVLGPCGVYARWPPFVGCHALAAVLVADPESRWGDLAAALGDCGAADVMSSLCLKWLAPCFVGSLPPASMLLLWDRLAQSQEKRRGSLFSDKLPPQWPLLIAARRTFAAVCETVVSKLREEGVLAADGGDGDEAAHARAFQLLARPAPLLPPGFDPCPASAEAAAAVLAKQHAAALSSLRADEAVPRVSAEAPFSDEDLAELRAQYEAMTMQCGTGDLSSSLADMGYEVITPGGQIGVTLEDMEDLVARIHPDYPTANLERLFNLLDSSGQGRVHFFEATVGLALLASCGPQERLRLLFMLFDADASGALSQDELFFLASTMLKVAGEEAWSDDASDAASHLGHSSHFGATFARTPAGGGDPGIMSLRSSHAGLMLGPRAGSPVRESLCRSAIFRSTAQVVPVCHTVSAGLERRARRVVRRLRLLADAATGDVSCAAWVQGALACPEICAALTAAGLDPHGASVPRQDTGERGLIVRPPPLQQLPRRFPFGCTIL